MNLIYFGEQYMSVMFKMIYNIIQYFNENAVAKAKGI